MRGGRRGRRGRRPVKDRADVSYSGFSSNPHFAALLSKREYTPLGQVLEGINRELEDRPREYQEGESTMITSFTTNMIKLFRSPEMPALANRALFGPFCLIHSTSAGKSGDIEQLVPLVARWECFKKVFRVVDNLFSLSVEDLANIATRPELTSALNKLKERPLGGTLVSGLRETCKNCHLVEDHKWNERSPFYRLGIVSAFLSVFGNDGTEKIEAQVAIDRLKKQDSTEEFAAASTAVAAFLTPEPIGEMEAIKRLMVAARSAEEVARLREYEKARAVPGACHSANGLRGLLLMFVDYVSIIVEGNVTRDALHVLSRLSRAMAVVTVRSIMDSLWPLVRVSVVQQQVDFRTITIRVIEAVERAVKTHVMVPIAKNFFERFLIFLKMSMTAVESDQRGFASFPDIDNSLPPFFCDDLPYELTPGDLEPSRLAVMIENATDEGRIDVLQQWMTCMQFKTLWDEYVQMHSQIINRKILVDSNAFVVDLHSCLTAYVNIKDLLRCPALDEFWSNMSTCLLFEDYANTRAVQSRWTAFKHPFLLPSLTIPVQWMLRFGELPVMNAKSPNMYKRYLQCLLNPSAEVWQKAKKEIVFPRARQDIETIDNIIKFYGELRKVDEVWFRKQHEQLEITVVMVGLFAMSIQGRLEFALNNSLVTKATAGFATSILREIGSRWPSVGQRICGFEMSVGGSLCVGDVLADLARVELEFNHTAFCDTVKMLLSPASYCPSSCLNRCGIGSALRQIHELLSAPSDYVFGDVIAILDRLVCIDGHTDDPSLYIVQTAVHNSLEYVMDYASVMSYRRDIGIFKSMVLQATGKDADARDIGVGPEQAGNSKTWEPHFAGLIRTTREGFCSCGVDVALFDDVVRSAHRLLYSRASKVSDDSGRHFLRESVRRSAERLNSDLRERVNATKETVRALQQCGRIYSYRSSHEDGVLMEAEEKRRTTLDNEIERMKRKLDGLPRHIAIDETYDSVLAGLSQARREYIEDDSREQLRYLERGNAHLAALIKTRRVALGVDTDTAFDEVFEVFQARHAKPQSETIPPIVVSDEILAALERSREMTNEEFRRSCDEIEKYAFDLMNDYRAGIDTEYRLRSRLEHTLAVDGPKLSKISEALASIKSDF